MVRRRGGRVIEFNLGSTNLTENGSVDYHFTGEAGTSLTRFVAAVLATPTAESG